MLRKMPNITSDIFLNQDELNWAPCENDLFWAATRMHTAPSQTDMEPPKGHPISNDPVKIGGATWSSMLDSSFDGVNCWATVNVLLGGATCSFRLWVFW